MKSHPILGKLAFQNRPCRVTHTRTAIGGSAPSPGMNPQNEFGMNKKKQGLQNSFVDGLGL